MPQTTMYMFDVNVLANVGANLGGVDDASEWFSPSMGATRDMQVLNAALGGNFPLLVTDLMVRTLAHTLQYEDASDFEALEPQSARDTAAMWRARVAMGGSVISAKDVFAAEQSVRKALPRELVRHARGQIDREDVLVLAGALAAIVRGDTDSVVVVTNDRGLTNCAGSLARLGISVLHTERFLQAVTGRRRSA